MANAPHETSPAPATSAPQARDGHPGGRTTGAGITTEQPPPPGTSRPPQPTDRPEPTGAPEPTDPAEPTGAAELTDPAEPTGAAELTDLPELTGAPELTDPAEPTGAAESTDLPEPADAAELTDLPEPADVPQPMLVAAEATVTAEPGSAPRTPLPAAAAASAVGEPAAPVDIAGLARITMGILLGMIVGFTVGLFAAVFASVVVGDEAAVFTLVLCTAGFGATGAAMGAGSARRAAEQAYHARSSYSRDQTAGGPPQLRPQPQIEMPQIGTQHAGTQQAGIQQGGIQRVGAQHSATQQGGAQQGGAGQRRGAQQVGGSPQAGGSRQGAEVARGTSAPPYVPPPPPPYVPPPLFPRPELPETPRWLLPAAAGAGVFAAVALPDAQVGLGIVLVSMVLGAAALPAVMRRTTPWTVAFGLAAYALISVAAVRDADWVVAILLVAGAGLGALAVSGSGFGWLGVLRGGASVLLALGPVPWFLATPLKRLRSRRRILPLLAGLGISAVLLGVFGLLFASADPVFATYLERATTAPDWAESAPLRIFLFVVFAALLAAVVLVALRPVADPVGPEVKVRVSGAVWLVPLTAVNLLFAAFVAVQLTALFGGDAWVLKTAGLSYAEYARQGFFQLVAVSVIVLGIVAVAATVLKTERRERWVLSGQLGVLCGLTMVVLFSAMHRLGLYIDAYGLSRLRLSVQATIWWLGALFALVLVAGAARLAGRGTGWLPRTIVLVTALGLGAFAVVNPDLRVAQSQAEVRGVARLDADYLGDLGAEAVPALDRLPEPLRSCVLADVAEANGLNGPDPWNGWNLARAEARALLAEHPVDPAVSCQDVSSRGG